jgi:hypothetical protein
LLVSEVCAAAGYQNEVFSSTQHGWYRFGIGLIKGREENFCIAACENNSGPDHIEYYGLCLLIGANVNIIDHLNFDVSFDIEYNKLRHLFPAPCIGLTFGFF